MASKCFYYVNFIIFIPVIAGLKMNVLFMVADDLRPLLGAYGDPIAITPNIDSIAAAGVVFTKAYCQQALCGPSRTSFLTSRRPDTTRLYDFYSYWREAAGNFTTMPQYLKENGFHTVSVGKIFHPGVASNFTDDYPYSWSDVPYRPSTEAYMRSKVCPGNDTLLHENIVCPIDVESQPEGTLPDLQSTDYAVKFLNHWNNHNEKQNKGFFLAVGFHKPHIPLKYPKKYLNLYPLESIPLAPDRTKTKNMPDVAWNPWTDLREREDVQALRPEFPYGPLPDDYQRLVKQSYYASVSYVDDQVGQLLKALVEVNSTHNTIIVFMGDHGWALGEHQEWSKYSNFEAAVRVPLIISVPNLTFNSTTNPFHPVSLLTESDFTKNLGNAINQFKHDRFTSHNLVELVDIFPTLVQLLGFTPLKLCPKNSSKEMLCTEGFSLVPTIRNAVKNKSSSQSGGKKVAFSQYPRPSLHPQNSSDKPHLKQIQIMGYSLRTQKYRYNEWVQFNHTTFTANWTQVYAKELYLEKPNSYLGEDVNVVDDPKYSKVTKRLSKLLRKGWKHALPSYSKKLNRKKVSKIMFCNIDNSPFCKNIKHFI
ncbi:hypothetical protein CHUAL_013549 [Chamberlinius hualienensis]